MKMRELERTASFYCVGGWIGTNASLCMNVV
jgi:hypothetical protein